MKTKLKNILIISFFLTLLLFIFTNSVLVIEEIINIIYLWIKKIFPSLFPFFIIGDILINYNFIYYLNYFFNPLFKFLFNINGNTSFIFLLSMISGFPSNAKYTKDLYQNNSLTLKESSKILAFTFFSNPLFIITMSKMIFNDSKITLLIILSHYLSNIIIGIILRNKNNYTFKKTILKKPLPLANILTTSINKSISTLLLILGTITIFVVLNTFINNYFNFPIFSGFLEITQGLNTLSKLNISINYKMHLMVSYLSFGGVSVHLQIKSILEDTPISLKHFYQGRLLHVLISNILLFILK